MQIVHDVVRQELDVDAWVEVAHRTGRHYLQGPALTTETSHPAVTQRESGFVNVPTFWMKISPKRTTLPKSRSSPRSTKQEEAASHGSLGTGSFSSTVRVCSLDHMCSLVQTEGCRHHLDHHSMQDKCNQQRKQLQRSLLRREIRYCNPCLETARH